MEETWIHVSSIEWDWVWIFDSVHGYGLSIQAFNRQQQVTNLSQEGIEPNSFFGSGSWKEKIF